jgi:hypothetical protein
MISSTIPSAKRVVAHIGGQDRYRRLVGQSEHGCDSDRCGGRCASHRGETNPIDPNRSSDVFEALIAQIVECEIEPPRGILLDTSRNANPAGFGKSFEPGRNIHAVAEDVLILDHDISDIDPDAEFEAVVRCAGIAFSHAALPFDRTT